MKLSAATIATMVLAGLLCGVISYWGAGRLSRPTRFEQRSAALTLHAQRPVVVLPGPTVFPQGTVCPSGPGFDRAHLSREITNLALSTGFQLKMVAVSLKGVETAQGALVESSVGFSGEGSYLAATQLLRGAADLLPRVFVRSLDIERKPGGVAMHFEGRVLCFPGSR